MKRSVILELTLCALFAALTAVCSQIAIPTPWQVPINLAFVAIFLAGGLLGAKYAAISMAAYILLGTAGVPVFAGFHSGLGTLFGATGGYIVGYILNALTVGLIVERWGRSAVVLPFAMILGIAPTYVLGAAWYAFGYAPGEHTLSWVLKMCVAIYLPGDALKIILCTVLIGRLYPVVERLRRRTVKAL